MVDVGSSNVVAIDLFVRDLLAYEAIVKPHSGHYHEFQEPAERMRSAMLRLVTATESDTFSMMRHLVEHMADGTDGAYSEYTITFLAASTHDERAKQLFMAVLYTTRSVVDGDWDELGESWLRLVDGNVAIRTFLHNYANSDQKLLGETYSGNIIRPARMTETLTSEGPEYTLAVAQNNYRLELNSSHPQVISFALSDVIQANREVDPEQPLVIVSEVLIIPTCQKFILDKSIHFFDDALAQLKALECVHGGHRPDDPTLILLPGIFYGAALSIISSNSGKTWRVSEINIVPPSLS